MHANKVVIRSSKKTDNTMTKKSKRTNSDLQNITQKSKAIRFSLKYKA